MSECCGCCDSSGEKSAAIDSYRVEIDAELELVRGVGFRLIHETGAPVPLSTLAAKANLSVEEAGSRLAEIESAGRARRDSDGDLVGIAGLGLEPTRHAIEVDGRKFWTWCALDAVGIFTALEATGEVRTQPPGDSDELRIRFKNGLTESATALFIAGGYDGTDVFETWCPKVNFFNTSKEAEMWSAAERMDGDVVSISEISEAAGAIWASVVNANMAMSGPRNG